MNASKPVAQLAVVVAAHLIFIAALLVYSPTRDAILQIIPVVASIVPSRRVEPPAPASPAQRTAPKISPIPAQEPRAVAPVTPQIVAIEPSPAQSSAMTGTSLPPPVSAAPPVSAPGPQSTSPAATPASQAAFTPPRADAAYLNNPKPLYPAASLRLGEAGRVVLSVQVSAAGTVVQVNVRTSSGSERLDQSALRAVRQWKFIPARRGDEAVAAQVLVPISFTPEND